MKYNVELYAAGDQLQVVYDVPNLRAALRVAKMAMGDGSDCDAVRIIESTPTPIEVIFDAERSGQAWVVRNLVGGPF